MSSVLGKRGLKSFDGQEKADISIDVTITSLAHKKLKIEYMMLANMKDIAIPPTGNREQMDNLWQHTCFEAFLGVAGREKYYEYNFSPSLDYAIYRFDSYRAGMEPVIDINGPDIHIDRNDQNGFTLTSYIDLSTFGGEAAFDMGLSAVIENTAGELSYWALEHPTVKPDFHNRDCFTLKLAPPVMP